MMTHFNAQLNGDGGHSESCCIPAEELDSDHARRVAELEQVTQSKLRERQKVHEEAFKHDMARYLSTGYLQLQGGRVT